MTLIGLTLALSATLASPTVEVAEPVAPLIEARLFNCNNGEQVSAALDQAAGVARVIRRGEVLTLFEQVGRKVPTYVTGLDTVILHGETATVFRGRERRLTCHQLPVDGEEGIISGTLSMDAPIELPAGTEVRVSLVDAARADAPAREIASQKITTSSNQFPLHFRIDHMADRLIHKPATYRLQARISNSRNQLLAITDTAAFVLEKDEVQAPTDLKLVPTPAQ